MKENNEDIQEADDSLLTKENKPYNLQSTSNEIQNIFKKIRKKNKENEMKINISMKEYGNIGSKDILISNENNIKFGKDDLDSKDLKLLIVNIISFISFYLSFILLSDYKYPVHFFLPYEFYAIYLLCFE